MLVALQKMNTLMYPIVKLYTYCSMNKQYIEGIQKWKKAYLMSVDNIAMWLYHSLTESETISLLFNEQKQIEFKKRFLGCQVTPNKTTNMHANSLREIIIYCIPIPVSNRFFFAIELFSGLFTEYHSFFPYFCCHHLLVWHKTKRMHPGRIKHTN